MRIVTLMCLWLTVVAAYAATSGPVVTTEPAVITTDSSPIVITFHADQGNAGLAGLTASTPVYAHTGLITTTSTSSTEWKYATKWLDNNAKYRMTYAGADTWTLTIPSIKEYYDLTDEQLATVTGMMFVFRNATGSREGKTSSGGDIAVDVRQPGFYVTVTTVPDIRVFSDNAPVTITAKASNSAADVTLAVGSKTVSGTGTVSLVESFITPGQYKAIASAKLGESEATDAVDFLRLSATSTAAYPGEKVKPGAVVSSDRSKATFAIAAPGKNSVLLVGSWNDFALVPEQQMKRADEKVTLPTDTSYIKNAWSLRTPYFWCEVNGLEPDKEYTYYYLVDGKIAVGDPYCNLVLDPQFDRYINPEVYPDMPEYPVGKVPDGTILSVLSTGVAPDAPKPLANKPAIDNLVIYELLTRDFTGTGNGDGNINGVIDKLDYIQSLGVNAVEIMPIMEFNGNDSWGYNPVFYFAPDKAYGTPADYRRLVNEIHARGMAVILDVVFNHADDRNPWQLMYESSQNPFFNATPPHAYNAFHDWNQDNPLVFRQWVDALRYWTEAYGVDGFRFDLVKGLGDNGSYGITWNRTTNSFLNPTEASTNAVNSSRAERIGRLREALYATAPGTYFICEDLAKAEEDKLLFSLGAVDWANINEGACQWAMGWKDRADLSRFSSLYDQGRQAGSTVSYAESHDEERCAYKQQQWGATGVKGNEEQQMRRLGSIAAMMLMTPGSHMIWQFEELGDAQPVKKADGNNNTDARKSCWGLLDNPLHAQLYDTYAALLKLRNSNPSLFGSDVVPAINALPSNWETGYTISIEATDGKKLFVAANPLTDRSLTVPTPMAGGSIAVSSAGIDIPVVSSDGSVTLGPGAFAVLVNSAVSGIEYPVYDNRDDEITAVYTLSGVRVDASGTLPSGVYIYVTRSGKASTRVVTE